MEELNKEYHAQLLLTNVSSGVGQNFDAEYEAERKAIWRTGLEWKEWKKKVSSLIIPLSNSVSWLLDRI